LTALARARAPLFSSKGPAGIGKSHLLAELRATATADNNVEREVPYGVVRQLFEPKLIAVESTCRTPIGS
jgi:hypothetical protein